MVETVPIEAVIFDFFGTLVPSFSLAEHRAVLREMAAIVGAPPTSFVERWFETFNERVTGIFPDAESNILSICREFFMYPEPGKCSRAVELRLDYERRQIVPRPSAVDTLLELRRRGYRTGLITDCSSELPVLWKETVFPPLFDATIFSAKVGMKKPNPEIYLKACEELGIHSQACLYVGDGGSRELSGAACVGMRPVLLFEESEQDNADTHRVDGEPWKGPRISDLKQVFQHLGGR